VSNVLTVVNFSSLFGDSRGIAEVIINFLQQAQRRGHRAQMHRVYFYAKCFAGDHIDCHFGPNWLVGRTRSQGVAPLGGSFPFLTGSSHFRSSQRPTATSSPTAAMPHRMPGTSGEKAPSPCCTRDRCCTAGLSVGSVERGLRL